MTTAQKRWGFIFLLILTVVLCLHVALVKLPPNYHVVTRAADTILAGNNPYASRPGLDFFKYSPLAGLLVAPFAYLVDEAGLFLFVFAQFWLLFWGFKRWAAAIGSAVDSRASLAVVAFFSVIFDTTVAIQNAQVNAAIFGLMLLASAQYMEGKPLRSGMVLSLAANLKLFPITLGLCLLTGFNRKYWAAFWGGLLLWFMGPAAIVGWGRNIELLRQWLDLMSWDRTRTLEMLDIGSFFMLHGDLSTWWRDPLAVLLGAAIGVGAWLLFRGKHVTFVHRYLLPINGLYILLFSYLSESPTSILAIPAIFLLGVEALQTKSRRGIYWLMWAGALALVPLFYSDLVPRAWNLWAEAVHLKTIGYLWTAAACCFLMSKTRSPLSGILPTSHGKSISGP
jgi:hypothetical protein